MIGTVAAYKVTMTTHVAALILSIMQHCSPVAESPDTYSGCEFDTALILTILTTEKRPMRLQWELEALEFNTRCPNGHYDRARDVDVCG